MFFLKIVKWCAIVWFLIIAGVQWAGGNNFLAFAFALVAFACWMAPRLLAGKKLASPRATKDFTPTIAHDNIALDTTRDLLWIRDISGATRVVRRGEPLSWDNHSQADGGLFRQRINLQIKDVIQPHWVIVFNRHSETWKSSAKKNIDERAEWFARIRAWDASAPEPTHDEVVNDHQALRQFTVLHATTDDQAERASAVSGFNMICRARGWDAREEWERMGSIYPGPTTQ